MDVKTLFAILAVGIIIGIGGSYVTLSPQTSSLQNQINTLTNEKNTLQTQLINLKVNYDKVPGLQQEISSLTIDKNVLQLQNTRLSIENAILQAKISILTDEKNDL